MTDAPAEPRLGLAARLAAILIGLVAIYLTLVLANLALVQAQKAFARTAAAADARALELDRRDREDAPMIAAAVAAGFQPLIFPDMVDDRWDFPRYNEVARETRLPPVGAQLSSPVYYCNEGYGLVTYETDRFGLRNPDAVWDDVGAVDLLAIGDSYVHGACVGAGETLTDRVSAGGHVALNLGMGSNHPLHYAYLARLFTPAVQPRYVATFFYPNDNLRGLARDVAADGVFADILAAGDDLARYIHWQGERLEPSERYRSAMDRYSEITADRIANGPDEQGPIDKLFKRDYWTIRHARVFLAGLLRGDEGLHPFARQALDEMAAQCRLVGCTPFAVYIPHSAFFRPDPEASRFRDALERYAGRIQMPFLDLTPALAPLGDGAYAPKGPHLSPEGYRTAAAAVETFLAELD